MQMLSHTRISFPFEWFFVSGSKYRLLIIFRYGIAAAAAAVSRDAVGRVRIARAYIMLMMARLEKKETFTITDNSRAGLFKRVRSARFCFVFSRVLFRNC